MMGLGFLNGAGNNIIAHIVRSNFRLVLLYAHFIIQKYIYLSLQTENKEKLE
jgi:hypothetical protein